jgi:hypothetical protein
VKCIQFWWGNLKTDTTWRNRHTWDNIIMDLKQTECKGTDRINLVLDRDECWAIVNTILNFQVPQNAWN